MQPDVYVRMDPPQALVLHTGPLPQAAAPALQSSSGTLTQAYTKLVMHFCVEQCVLLGQFPRRQLQGVNNWLPANLRAAVAPLAFGLQHCLLPAHIPTPTECGLSDLLAHNAIDAIECLARHALHVAPVEGGLAKDVVEAHSASGKAGGGGTLPLVSFNGMQGGHPAGPVRHGARCVSGDCYPAKTEACYEFHTRALLRGEGAARSSVLPVPVLPSPGGDPHLPSDDCSGSNRARSQLRARAQAAGAPRLTPLPPCIGL